MEAEWAALLLGLQECAARDIRHIEVLSCSTNLVNQATGKYKTTSACVARLRSTVHALCLEKHIKIYPRVIAKGEGKRARDLARAALDGGVVL